MPTVGLLLPFTMRFLAAIVPAQGGKGMIRWSSLMSVCGAMGLYAASSGHSANESACQVGDWVGRAYWNQKNKRLDRCSAQLMNPGKITMIYSLNRHYMWN